MSDVPSRFKAHTLIRHLLPGPIGVGIGKNGCGECCVTTCTPKNIGSPLHKNDIIYSLNGITLHEVEGGIDAWAKLFAAFDTMDRKVAIYRITDLDDEDKCNCPSRNMVHVNSNSSHNTSSNKKQKVDNNCKDSKQNMEIISLLDDSDDEKEAAAAVITPEVASSAVTGSPYKSKVSPEVEIIENIARHASSKPRGNLKDDRSYGGSSASSNLGKRKSNNEGGNGRLRNGRLTPEDSSDIEIVEDSSLSWQPRGNLKDDRCDGVGSTPTTNLGKRKSNEGDEDEELVIVATKGQNALADFPHSRENCVTHSFGGDKKLHCENCYCYVCDAPAKDCNVWGTHCAATHTEPSWRAERERAKRGQNQPASVAASRPDVVSRSLSFASSSSSTSRYQGYSNSTASSRSAEFSVRKLLGKVTTVHPVEMQPPVSSGFVTPLRHYQKQSLAFMVETERKEKRGGWLCDEVGMGKTAVTLALVATNPLNPKSMATKEQIRAAFIANDAFEQKKDQIHIRNPKKFSLN